MSCSPECRRWPRLAQAQAAGNLVAFGAPNVRPAPLTVPMDDEALAIFDDLDQDMTRRQRAAVGSEQSAVLARVWENTAKVALVKAVSANPAEPVIRGVDAQWAREVVDHCVATLLIQAGRHLADNEIERFHKRVIELIRAAGAKGIRQNELTRRTQFIEPKLRARDSADADRERAGCRDADPEAWPPGRPLSARPSWRRDFRQTSKLRQLTLFRG